MQELPIIMPKMGESVLEATIIKWLKKEGDTMLESESIVEVATDKVDSEIPAPYTGRLMQILAQEGQVVSIGSPIAIISTDVHTPVIAPNFQHTSSPTTPTTPTTPPEPIKATSPSWPRYDARGRIYSPLVRHIAEQEALSWNEVEKIPGTGQNNRLTKQDLLTYLHYRPSAKPALQLIEAEPSPYPYAKPGDEIIPMDRVRKIIAERMVHAVQTIPHVTSFVEADVTNLVAWRTQHKALFKQKTGIDLTYTPLFVQAIAQAIAQFPLINVSVVGTYIIKRKAINIGIAVALPDGNLIVPVVKGVDQLDLPTLATSIHELVHKARNAQLSPDDIAEGTYTVSNIGSFQNLMGTPIIMQPQVAILALGSIVKKPGIIETPAGDQIAIRHTMYLSHTYDHRVVDGALGGQFVKNVADRLERFSTTTDFKTF